MRIHKDINNLPVFKQAVITIGSFDGVHLGHKKLINKVNRLAKSTGGESVLITFDPHPRQIVFPGDDFQLLSTIEEKIILLEVSEQLGNGVYILCVDGQKMKWRRTGSVFRKDGEDVLNMKNE